MNSKGISIAALVCGVVGVVGVFFSSHVAIPVITLVIAIAGIILGAIGMKKAKENGESKGLAVAGLVCGIVGAVFSVIGLACYACACVAAKALTEMAKNAQ